MVNHIYLQTFSIVFGLQVWYKMTNVNKFFGLVCAVSALFSLAPQNSANAQSAYSECSCVSQPAPYPGGVGKIVSLRGEVLVNNIRASAGQILPTQSEIMVGSGSVDFDIGLDCSGQAGPNETMLITRPGGRGSNLCLKRSSNSAGSPDIELNSDGKAIMIGALGAAGAVALIPALADGDKRRPASP